MFKIIIRITSIDTIPIIDAFAILVVYYWYQIEFGLSITEYQSLEDTGMNVWNKITLGIQMQVRIATLHLNRLAQKINF